MWLSEIKKEKNPCTLVWVTRKQGRARIARCSKSDEAQDPENKFR